MLKEVEAALALEWVRTSFSTSLCLLSSFRRCKCMPVSINMAIMFEEGMPSLRNFSPMPGTILGFESTVGSAANENLMNPLSLAF